MANRSLSLADRRTLGRQSDLPPHLQNLYGWMLTYAEYHGGGDSEKLSCSPSIASLSDLTNTDPRQVIRNLKEMARRGYLSKESCETLAGRRLPNTYLFLDRPGKGNVKPASPIEEEIGVAHKTPMGVAHKTPMGASPKADRGVPQDQEGCPVGQIGVAHKTPKENVSERKEKEQAISTTAVVPSDLIGQEGRERAMNETQEQREKTISRWPTTLETSKDLAGWLRRKMESAGGKLTAFKVTERCFDGLLADGHDPYEVALVYDAAIDANGPVEEIWNLLDPRAFARLRERRALVKGTAYYVYLAHYADVGADNREAIFALIEDLEDAIVAEARTTEKLIRADLDGRVLGLLGRPVTANEAE